LHAFSFALHHTAAISYLYNIYENKKLSSQFYYGLSFGLGGFSGSLFAGYFYGNNIFLYAALIASLSFLFLLLRTKVPTTPQKPRKVGLFEKKVRKVS